jgi:chemotaxis protein CheZ
MTALSEPHVKNVIDYLQNQHRGDDISLSDVMALAGVMTESLENFFKNVDENISRELCAIASEISTMKQEVASLRANDLRGQRLPDAGRELDAVVAETEAATHKIMETAEAIMELDSSDPGLYKESIETYMVDIFEACSFQDITGQRIAKVVETLNTIEKRVSQFIEKMKVRDAEDEGLSDKDQWRRDNILHGPQHKDEGVNQDDIDALFG